MDPKATPVVAVLDILLPTALPLGSRAIQRELSSRGIEMSESSVSRLLAGLDAQGLTQALGQKGRQLTPAGRQVATKQVLDAQRAEYFERAFDMRGVEDLVDHLVARRGLEREAARAAALRATPQEIQTLRQMVDGTLPPVLNERLAFHRVVSDASHNKQITAISNTLFVEQLDPLDSVVFLIGLRHGVLARWDDEHRQIVDHIASRDPDGAEKAMAEHLDATIRDTEEFAAAGNDKVIEQALMSSRAKGSPGSDGAT